MFCTTAVPIPSPRVGIGVDCDFLRVCFAPDTLAVKVGGPVTFFIYGDAGDVSFDLVDLLH